MIARQENINVYVGLTSNNFQERIAYTPLQPQTRSF